VPGVAACWGPKCSMPCPPAWCCAAGACRVEGAGRRPSRALEVTGVLKMATDRCVGHSRHTGTARGATYRTSAACQERGVPSWCAWFVLA
jgi:hypothetical protein